MYSKATIVLWIILSLAVIGLLVTLITDPQSLILQLLFIAFIVIAFFFLFRYLNRKGMFRSSGSSAGYRQAYRNQKKQVKKNNRSKKTKLRVIKGQKK